MLKVNSPLFKLITILFRQMNLSIARYSTEENFYVYFDDKFKFYQYAIEELEKILDSNYNYYPLLVMLRNAFFVRKLEILDILLIYKVLKDFVEMLESEDFDYMLHKNKSLFSTREIYWQLLIKNIPKKQRKLINETEHFGQNFKINHYRSIEETLLKLDVKIEIIT